MERKRAIRKDLLKRRDAISVKKCTADSASILHRLLTHPWFVRAERICTYISHGSEVDTLTLCGLCLEMGKAVYCPRVLDEGRMEFYRIASLEELEEGYRGIKEPPMSEPLDGREEDGNLLMIMPLVGFDPEGNRLGYGGGFYDRYLADKPQIKTIALAFDEQCFKEGLPTEEFDVRPGQILTPDRKKEERGKYMLEKMGERALKAKGTVELLSTEEKNRALEKVSKGLVNHTEAILLANEKDMKNGREKGMSQGLLDRLKLTEDRIKDMAEGIRQIVNLPDPIGEILEEWKRPNGLLIRKKRVPMGVIGIIYEARPNVTADAFALCFKTGNVVILKGGSDAIHSNAAIAESIRESLKAASVTEDAIQLIMDTDRETTSRFMKLNRYIDVLIPRGGAGLIRTVVENSTIPVIETGTGNCHIYVDKDADLQMALGIIINAKTQRIGVCNACESLVIHREIAGKFLPLLRTALLEKKVEIRGDEEVCLAIPESKTASEEDYGAEYLDYILSVKLVGNIQEAIAHINRYHTMHSDCIVTENQNTAELFLNAIDSACVYWNASTRFTDGFEFGFGAEIGISTQKLHARGPMGLKELTAYKYLIQGNGQIRS